MNDLFTAYKDYLKWIDGQNRMIRMRNGKKLKAQDPNSIRRPELEEDIEPSLLGFLEWGANEKT